MTYLQDIVVVFGAALVVLLGSHRLRIPPLVGFLLTGILVGPSGFRMIGDPQHVEVFAELGVVFLLFSIGLEFSGERIKQLGRFLVVGGTLQASLTIGLVASVAYLAGYGGSQPFYFGLVIALSSTAIVLKLYSDRREIEAPHGRVVMGILLFQDFLIVPFLVAVPVLAGTGTSAGGEVALHFGGGLLAVAAVFFLGRYLLPSILYMIVETRIRELVVLGALFAGLGGGLLTRSLGFSMALGAFLAGMLIAESEYNHQVLSETTPFRDVFNSIFFISIGMLLQLDFAIDHAPLVVALTAGIVVLKAIVVMLAVALLRFPLRTCLVAGLGLAQIGEFSFVLARAGHEHGLLDDTLYQTVIASAVLTMLATPLLVHLAPVWADRWGERRRRVRIGAPAAGAASMEEEIPASGGPGHPVDHVVITGFGLNGRHLARVLRAAGRPYLVIEMNGRTVREARAEGEPIFYGDATRRDVLERAGTATARMAVFAVSDPRALRQGVRLAREINPRLYIVARTRQFSEIGELKRCGADEVIAEEFETSIEIVTRILTRLHVPRSVIRAEARLLRHDGYEMLRAPAVPAGVQEKVLRVLDAGTTDTFLLAPEHAAVGKSIRELGLRRETGASIIAIVRADRPITNPAADLGLEGGDVLVLVGNHAEVERAFQYLEEKSEEAGRGAAGESPDGR